MPKLLDLFCGAGGCSMGYHRAGFEVEGVDIKPMPRYPFKFYQADALEFLKEHGHEYDFIHASPPCQRYARISRVYGAHEDYPDLIEPCREILEKLGKPYVIENVPDSKMQDSLILCGSMFGLGAVGELDGKYRQLRRHRFFNSNIFILAPQCSHKGEPVGVYGDGGPQRATRNRGYMGGRKERKIAMGIDWMKNNELSQAIPPAYTEWIGRQILEACQWQGREK